MGIKYTFILPTLYPHFHFTNIAPRWSTLVLQISPHKFQIWRLCSRGPFRDWILLLLLLNRSGETAHLSLGFSRLPKPDSVYNFILIRLTKSCLKQTIIKKCPFFCMSNIYSFCSSYCFDNWNERNKQSNTICYYNLRVLCANINLYILVCKSGRKKRWGSGSRTSPELLIEWCAVHCRLCPPNVPRGSLSVSK